MSSPHELLRMLDPQAPDPEDAGAETPVGVPSRPDTSNLQTANIMIVDDEPINCKIARKYLSQAGYSHFLVETDATRALEAIRDNRPDLVVLDIMMPNVSGLEILEAVRADEDIAYIPVLILTASTDAQTKHQALELGATDFLTKPIDSNDLLPRVRNALILKAFHDHLLSYAAILKRYAEEKTIELQHANERLEGSNQALETELTERRNAEKRLRHQALHDALTDLPNRALLMERMERCIARFKRQSDHFFAILFLDFDDFKVVNDSLGHRLGDQLLVEAARRLTRCLRALDTASRPQDETTARLGGDEFVVLLDGMKSLLDAVVVAERIRDVLSEPFELEGREVTVRVSIGVASSESNYDDPEAMLRDADTALYEAKNSSRGDYVVFNEEMRRRVLSRMELDTDLRNALPRRQLYLQYQPIVSLDTGRITAFEALLRWEHPARGLISPADFISLAEEKGLIIPIGQWVLKEACREVKSWREQFPNYADLSVSVNVSPRQLVRNDLVGQVRTVLEETGLDPRALKLEITEHAMIENGEATELRLNELREAGVGVYLDDFGTGYSSLSYLHSLPVDGIKLDRSFVNGIALDGKHATTIQAVVTLSMNRGFQVIAEGVETLDQIAQLQALECSFAQGYYFAKPLPTDEAAAVLATGGDWPTKLKFDQQEDALPQEAQPAANP